MELDHRRHHRPARHRLGVAPAQPRNLIRLPNYALLGSRRRRCAPPRQALPAPRSGLRPRSRGRAEAHAR